MRIARRTPFEMDREDQSLISAVGVQLGVRMTRKRILRVASSSGRAPRVLITSQVSIKASIAFVV